MLRLFCNHTSALYCGDDESAKLDSRVGHVNTSKSRRISNGLLVGAKDGDKDGDLDGDHDGVSVSRTVGGGVG